MDLSTHVLLKNRSFLTCVSLLIVRLNILDLAKGQMGEGVVMTFALKGVSVGCSIMNNTFVKLLWPPK